MRVRRCFFRPEWTQSNLVALTVHPCLLGRIEAQIGCPQTDNFLNACAGITHHREQRVIPLPRERTSINPPQQRLHVFTLQILDWYRPNAALERYGEDLLKFTQPSGYRVER
jgi:hypothetical protein